MQKAWLGVAFVSVVLSVPGCGKKDEECAAMLPVAAKGIEALKASVAATPTGSAKDLSAAALAIANAADKLALDVSKKAPMTPELQKASTDYQAMAKGVAAAARDDANALDDMAAVEPKTRADADPDRKTLAASQDKVKQRCADHPAPECKSVMSLTAGLATATDKPEQLDKIEADLGKIKLRDATLSPLVSTLRGSITSLAKTLRDATDAAVEMKSMQAKRNGTKAALDAALAKEPPITASVTAFCSSK